MTLLYSSPPLSIGLPRWLSSKEPTCTAGDMSSIPGLGRPLKKEMATHSSILTWKIPWTEEPGGLQSMRSRVGHNTATAHTPYPQWKYISTETTDIPYYTLSFFPYGDVYVLSRFSCVSETLATVAHQAPLSMGFSRQEYWSGLPCPPLEDLPDPGIKPTSVSCIGRWVLYY